MNERENQDSVLGLLDQTRELLLDKGQDELATTYLEAGLILFCAWNPDYIPKRGENGELTWSEKSDESAHD